MFDCFFSGLRISYNFETISKLTGDFFPLIATKEVYTQSSQQQRNQVKSDCCCHQSDLLTGGYCIEIIQEDFILQFYTSHNIKKEKHV